MRKVLTLMVAIVAATLCSAQSSGFCSIEKMTGASILRF